MILVDEGFVLWRGRFINYRCSKWNARSFEIVTESCAARRPPSISGSCIPQETEARHSFGPPLYVETRLHACTTGAFLYPPNGSFCNAVRLRAVKHRRIMDCRPAPIPSLLRRILLSHRCNCAQAWIEEPQNVATRTKYMRCSRYALGTSKSKWYTCLGSPLRMYPHSVTSHICRR